MRHQAARNWFTSRNWEVFSFQQACWEAILAGQSGMLNAPTGSGKTYAVWLGMLERNPNPPKGLRVLWITPLRALSRDITEALQQAATQLNTTWTVALRTGDTDTKTRAALQRKPPTALVTTPESLQLMLASKQYAHFFSTLDAVVVDEWHELMSTKRGVQMELALSRLRSLNPQLLTWGISATIGNLTQAMDVLLGPGKPGRLIRAGTQRFPEIRTVFPDEVERLPWAGHLGIHLLPKVLEVIAQHKSTLLFTNTRSQAEIWYRELLEAEPSLAGCMAMHHGSIDRELRSWVEDALHSGILKVVVCTSSLDLGVDFRPVDNIIQIGSPKGVARFLQRAGRSGHRPGQISRIWFVPTHALELIELSAIREALNLEQVEPREPITLAMDVLVQYLVTLAVSDGFKPDALIHEIRSTHAFSELSEAQWNWALQFISTGGQALQAYPDFCKVVPDEHGNWVVKDKRTALRHRLHIGTIVSDPMLTVKYQAGGRIGTVEEWFVAKLKPGDVFWFGGKVLELVQVRDLQVQVKRSNKKQGQVPQWMGGRMPLSSQLSDLIRAEMGKVSSTPTGLLSAELQSLEPVFELQSARSLLPGPSTLLIEAFETRDGHHLFVYPFEGRLAHEGLAALIGYRIGKMSPISFSYAMNDYGFELLSDQPIPIEEALELDLFRLQGLDADLEQSLNASELARRRFREIAAISGLVFQGFPGKPVGIKGLQSSSRLLFDVLEEYDAQNELRHQAFREVFVNQLEIGRIRAALERIQHQSIELRRPNGFTPLAFPIMADRLRERISTESIEDRIRKLVAQQTR